MKPKVSVIMPVYNSSKYLDSSINCVITQTYSDLELIIIDDGSYDDSKSIIDKYLLIDNRIKYIFQNNKGIAGARNTGITNSSGRYIALLDADDLWLPHKLENCVNVISKDANIGLVHSAYSITDNFGNVRDSTKCKSVDQSGLIFRKLVLRRANIAALTVLFKRECCEKIGLFDEDKDIMGVDDRDMWIRISKYYRIEYIDLVLAYWRKHESNYSGRVDKMLPARIKLLEKLFVNKSIDKNLYRMAMARIYKEAGDLFLISDKKSARKYYNKSIRYWPFELFSYVNLAKTFLKNEQNLNE